MRYLVLSDIHANMDAFEAVLAAAAAIPYDRLLVLGDLVGYGADPNAVVDRVRALAPHAMIRGNHDKVASGVESADGFNSVARIAIQWTHDTLTDDNRAWLAALPMGPVSVDADVEVCHGTPYDEDAYVFEDADARRALEAASRRLCLFGHTHVQIGYRVTGEDLAADVAAPGTESPVDEGRYLINPGSVGQPRDGDPQAAFAVLDTGTGLLAMHRIEYPVASAQARILAAGLPDVLAHRLSVGR